MDRRGTRAVQHLVGVSRVIVDIAEAQLYVTVRRGLLTIGVGDACGIDLSWLGSCPSTGRSPV